MASLSVTRPESVASTPRLIWSPEILKTLSAGSVFAKGLSSQNTAVEKFILENASL